MWHGPIVFCTVMGLAPFAVHGGDLIYEPRNPSFGGNPLNGNYLLNNAQAQDTTKDPDAATPRSEQSPLQRFNEQLERSILSRLTSTLSSSIISDGGALKPGTLETTDFIINVIDVGDGRLQIMTTDKSTGESTSFEVDTLF